MDTVSPLPTFKRGPLGHRRARSLDSDAGKRPSRAQRLTVITASRMLQDDAEGTEIIEEDVIELDPWLAKAPQTALDVVGSARSQRSRQQSVEERRTLQLQAAVTSYHKRRNSEASEKGLLPSAPLKSPLFPPTLFDSPATKRRTHTRCATEPGRIVLDKARKLGPPVPTLDELVAWHVKRQDQKPTQMTAAAPLTPRVAVQQSDLVTPEGPRAPPKLSPAPVVKSNRAVCRGHMMSMLSKRVGVPSPTLIVA